MKWIRKKELKSLKFIVAYFWVPTITFKIDFKAILIFGTPNNTCLQLFELNKFMDSLEILAAVLLLQKLGELLPTDAIV